MRRETRGGDGTGPARNSNGSPPALPQRYSNAQRVGVGGMGEVYRAVDRSLERTVAVKVLSATMAQDGDARRRFTREALASARLSDHPNVVNVYDVGEWLGRPYLVMEYIPGGTVADRLRQGPVPHALALSWLDQAADAVDAIHLSNLVHRDVTPGNLLLDESGRVKLGDFGIVRISDAAAGLTTIGLPVGSVGYMAPEQMRGEGTGPATDIYGLGVVAYELLTGARPFEGRAPAAEMAAHLHEPVPPASGLRPGLPAQVDAVLARALAKLPASRPRTGRAFVNELRDALAATERDIEPASARLHPMFQSAPERARAPTPVMVGAVLLVLAVIVIILVLLLS